MLAEGSNFHEEVPHRSPRPETEIPLGHHALDGTGITESDFEQGVPSSGHYAFNADRVDEANPGPERYSSQGAWEQAISDGDWDEAKRIQDLTDK